MKNSDKSYNLGIGLLIFSLAIDILRMIFDVRDNAFLMGISWGTYFVGMFMIAVAIVLRISKRNKNKRNKAQ